MKYLFLSFIVALTLISCNKDLAFETINISKESKLDCKDNCPKISIEIPKAINQKPLADSINSKLFKEISSITYLQDTPINSTNLQELVDDFIDTYENLKKKYPSDHFGWEADIKGEIIHQSNQIINIKLDYYTFTGGAHGYKGTNSLLFDIKTGNSLTIDSIITNENELSILLERKFREKYGIKSGENINSTGLMFENDKFQLPKNIFFQKEGVLFFYNTYEVAAYVEGPKEIFLDYETANQFLKFK